MLDVHSIAEAARYTDAELQEMGSLDAWAAYRQIDVQGFVYVAEQRGLRAAFARDGKDPRKLSPTEFQVIRLSRESREEMAVLTATWMDGFAIGVTAARRNT